MDFEVRHIDGSTVKLISSEHKCAITSATQTRKLCGNDTVTINLQSATYIEFQVGDKITIFGTTYTLNQLPTVKKESERSYTYTLVFEGLQYTLIDRVFLMPDNTQGDNLMFDLAGMLDVLDDNINRGNSGKQYEFVLDESLEETEYKNLSLTGKNCLQVLQQLCQKWDTEFVFAEEPTRIAIYIGVAGSTFPTTFKYGRGGGVYELNREKGASDICTRLFVYGGTQNLTYYRHNRLCLPSKEKNQSYVEDATAQAVYGIKEQVKNFDDIYPNRIGTITSLSGCDYNEFIDSNMADSQFGFDLNEKWANNADDCAEWLALKGLENTEANRTIYYNDVAGTATKYLMAGATAKIHFNTGALAGYECDLHSYTHSSQKFVLKPLVDENGYDFPSKTNAAFKLAVGDEYVILDINLPTAYKTQAESKLATEAASYFATVCRPQPKYTLTIEPIALKHIVGPSTADTEIFKVGDLINISDPTGGVESATIRIDQFVRNLLDPFDYKLTLTDEITYSQQVRTLIEVDAIKRVVEESKIYDVNRIRRGWKDAEELYNQMFDTEGHYYSEKIAPLSIDTQMLKVGARSQQLVLQNVLFQPNYNANPANLQISAGSLVHYTIAEPDIKTWTMSAYSGSNVPSTAQYVYAKCAKNGTTGTWLVTDQAIIFDSEPSYYHFLVGSLSSVDSVSNTRNFAATYGFTTINGRNITTGVIKSADGSGVIIDLDNNTITGNIKFLSGGQAVDAEQFIGDSVDDAVSEIEIGGANIARATENITIGDGSHRDWQKSEISIGGGGTGTRSVIKKTNSTPAKTDVVQIAQTSNSSGECSIAQSNITKLVVGETYTLSCYAKATSGSPNLYLQLDAQTKVIAVTSSWVRYSLTAIHAADQTGRWFIGSYNSNGTIQICGIKLEQGTVATDWTPAPEDSDYLKNALAEATAGSTEIEGGLILTKMIIAGEYQNQSGMAGVEASSVAFWAGGSLNGAEAMSTPVVIKKDGTTRLGILRLSSSGNITMPVGGKSRLNITGSSLPAPSIDNWTGDTWATASSVPSVTLSPEAAPTTLTMQVISTASGKRGHNGMPVYGTGSGYFFIRKTSSGTGSLGEVTLQMKAGETYNGLQRFYGLPNIVNDNDWHYAALNFSSVSTPYNETESRSGIAVVLQISGSGTFECTFFSNTNRDRSGNYGVHVWWASDITVPITTLANNGLMVLYNDSNYFRTTQVGSALRTTIKGETDIPGVLWAGRITAAGDVPGTPSFKNTNVTLSKNGTSPSDTSLYNFTYTGISGTPAIMVTPEPTTNTGTGWTAQVISLNTSAKTFSVRIKRDNTSEAAAFHLVIFGTT